jgi:hypothetical protein
MYFNAGGRYYVPFLATDGKETYVLVDRPPQPPAAPSSAATPAPGAATEAAGAPPATAVRTVQESLAVPAGTLLIVRLANAVSSDSAGVGDRFRGYLDQDLSAGGRLVTPRGAHVYGVVSAVDRRHTSLSLTLSDVMIGGTVVAVTTQPLSAPGGSLPAQSPQAFTVATPFRVEIVTNVAVR